MAGAKSAAADRYCCNRNFPTVLLYCGVRNGAAVVAAGITPSQRLRGAVKTSPHTAHTTLLHRPNGGGGKKLRRRDVL